jgi:hypothetical protein
MTNVRLRPELDLATMPVRMQRLAIDDRGYPVPWFVAWLDGKPEFRAMDAAKWTRAVRERRCWVCGDPLGAYLTFVVGPMCGINRTTAEPPCHRECAVWSAKNCPFLARPHMVRREDEVAAELSVNFPGTPILRNPGVTLLWTTRRYSVFNDGTGKPLIHLGDPVDVVWVCEGRAATREEVEASIAGGLPFLQEQAEAQDRREGRGAGQALERLVVAFARHLPA